MHLQVLQEDLGKALNSGIRFVSNRSSLPILNNFLIVAEKNKLKISATNLEMSINTVLGAKIETEGKVTVPAKLFVEIISNLEKGQIELNLQKEQLEVKGASFKGKLATVPANDFPAIPQSLDDKKSFTLESKPLINTLSKVLFSSSLDETRPVLTGVLFVFEEDKLSLVASDGFRLSKKTINLPKKIIAKQIIVPRASLLEIIKLGSSVDEFIFELKEEDNQLVVKIGDNLISTRLIEGNFPDFGKIIPSSSTTSVVVDKADLTRVVKLSAVFARESSNIVKLKTIGETLTLVSESSKGGSQVSEIEAKSVGPEVEISFNYKFMEDFLNLVTGESVEIKLTDSVSPAIFVDELDKDFLHLIMPVRVQS